MKLPEVLNVLVYPDKGLRKKPAEVAEITDQVREACADLAATMQAHGGAGIAANQCGIDCNVFLIAAEVAQTTDDLVCINPVVENLSADTTVAQEGCLSFSGAHAMIKRPKSCTLRATNLAGAEFSVDTDGFLARAIQHEFDHLSGKLMLDLMGSMKSKMFKKRLMKAKHGR